MNAYAACRTRATGAAMEARYWALQRIVRDVEPCTVRQVFYQAEIRGIDAIEQHLPPGTLDVLRVAEESEREILQMFAAEANDLV